MSTLTTILEQEPTLREQLAAAFPTAEFGRHETDLYVKVVPGIIEWLRANYPFYGSITSFRHQETRDQWLDIPFAAWTEKYGNQKSQTV